MITKNGPPETERRHIGGMAKYTIHPGEGGGGFEVSVISNNGAKQTMLGFKQSLRRTPGLQRTCG
jgi:hypothetical protein